MSLMFSKCCICGHFLKHAAATVHGGIVGPVCARKLGLKVARRPRSSSTRARDQQQLDWVAQAAEASA